MVKFEYAEDVCALPLVRRMAALLDRNPELLKVGDPLPIGWHVMLFNPPTKQCSLRSDGAADLGFEMPDLNFPRLMMGGRSIVFESNIPIGATVKRVSKLGAVSMKKGRSGSFALVEVKHRLSLAENDITAVVETINYILRPADNTEDNKDVEIKSQKIETEVKYNPEAIVRTIIPDETMLFRYSAITDNPHRIHYDRDYAKKIEGYPDLVVNGSLPQVMLLEIFRDYVGRDPIRYKGRNCAPIFCGERLRLSVVEEADHYNLVAHTASGEIAIEAKAW